MKREYDDAMAEDNFQHNVDIDFFDGILIIVVVTLGVM